MVKQQKQCECGKSYAYINQHLKSAFHINWEKSKNETKDTDDEKSSKTNESDDSKSDDGDMNTLEEINDDENIEFDIEDDFLTDLETDKFVSEDTLLERDMLLKKQNEDEFLAKKRELTLEKERVKIEKMKLKPTPKPRAVKEEKEPDTDLFSDKPSEILGEKKLILLKKIKTYKHLFQDIPEVKKFKIKKNPTEEDLQTAINEIDAIINTNSIDAFISDALFESIAVCEGLSKIYVKKYDISGLSQALKSNVQFLSVLKQLYLRYNTFQQIPPEYQAVLIISTTAFLVIQKNKQDSAIELLNEKIIV